MTTPSDTPPDHQENRRFPRYEVDLRVDVKAGESIVQPRIQNLSLGGICLQTPALEEVGTKVDLVIHTDEGMALSLRGEVVWVNREPPTDVGIRYLELDAATRTQLERVIEHIARTHDV